MHIVRNEGILPPQEMDAFEADRHARLMEDILIDIEDLDPQTFPPDRRYILADKEAWIYEHGNICELVYVRI
jgi:hypothetical protein